MQAGTSTPADEVRSKLDEAASTIGEQAQRIANTQLGSQKSRAADSLQSIAQTIRDGSSNLQEQQPQVASLGQEAAARIEQLSDYVEQHDVGDMVGDAERLARQQPAIFLGAAFAVGFVAARFLKASNPAPTRPSYGDGAMDGSSSRMGYGMSGSMSGSTTGSTGSMSGTTGSMSGSTFGDSMYDTVGASSSSMGGGSASMGDSSSSMGDGNTGSDWSATSPYGTSNGGVLEP